MSRVFAHATVALAVLAAGLSLSACGGGGGGSKKGGGVINPNMGRVKIDVAWPVSKSRLVPSHARSIRVNVKDGTTLCGTCLIVKPDASETIGNLPVGEQAVEAFVYASADGTGNPIAWARTTTRILDGQTDNVTLSLNTSVDHLESTPNPFVIGAGSVLPLNVTAKDEAGDVVMLDPAAITYVSSNPALLSVDATGIVTAGTETGVGTITVTDANSNKSITIAAQVAIGVVVSPSTLDLGVNQSATLAATIIGSTNPEVTWSVVEPDGGTISPAGVYTAPATRGTFHIAATSSADSGRKSLATVTISAGNIGVGIE